MGPAVSSVSPVETVGAGREQRQPVETVGAGRERRQRSRDRGAGRERRQPVETSALAAMGAPINLSTGGAHHNRARLSTSAKWLHQGRG